MTKNSEGRKRTGLQEFCRNRLRPSPEGKELKMRDYDREEELREDDRYADFLSRQEQDDCEDDREDERQAINREKRNAT